MEQENPLPDLKTDPKYGFYPWWPQDGDDWVHPEDVELARSVIPSPRIWRREGQTGDFLVLSYGDLKLRVRRTLWREAPHEGFDVGDLVEVLPHGMKNEPCTGEVRDVHWDDHECGVRYLVEAADGTMLERPLEARDLKQVEAPSPREQARMEPSGEESDLEVEDQS